MTVVTKVLILSKQLENVQTTQYTATNVTAIIDKCSLTNTTAATVVFSLNLVNSGGVAGADNLVISQRSIQPGETYLCPEIVGQTLKNGDFVSTLVSSALALTCRMSGREIS